MGQKGFTRGGRALLFDRLSHSRERDAPTAGLERELRVNSGAALRQSVRRELENLLNARCPVSRDSMGSGNRSVIHYGVAGPPGLNPQSLEARATLERELVLAIEAFEPRLREVRVWIGDGITDDPHPKRKREHVPRSEGGDGIGSTRDSVPRLAVRIDAVMVSGDIREPVSFPVHKTDSGEWKLIFPEPEPARSKKP